MSRLQRNVFQTLYQDVEEKFINFYTHKFDQKPKVTQIHGLQGYDRSKPTLAQELHKHEAVKKYLAEIDKGKEEHQKTALSPRYLYNKRKNDYEKGKNEIVLQSPYDKIFFLYLGFESAQAYSKSQIGNVVDYSGYYYSYKHHEIHKFTLQIDYDRKPNFEKVEIQEYTVEERGFHDNDRDPIYRGYAYRLDGKMHIVLWNEGKSDKMKMILDSGDNPSGNPAMRGAILAISSLQGHSPMNLETLIVKKEYNLTEADELGIRRYMFLHRYNFRIKAEILNLKAMKAKGADVHLIDNFVGCWQTIRFDENYQNLVVSILHVRDDYRIFCYTNQYQLENYNRQVCIPDIAIIDYFASRTLCLASYPNQGARIISNIMLKIPVGEKKLVGGGMLFVGKDGMYPINRSIALLKDDRLRTIFEEKPQINEEKLAQELKVIPIDKIKTEIKGNTAFEQLYNLLIKLEKENGLPKRLK